MKILIVTSLFLLLEASVMKMVAVEKFKDFVATYNKEYNGVEEHQKRFKIFTNNLKEIERLNKEAKGLTTYGINEFSDLTWEEFKKKRLVGPPANAGRSKNYSAPIRLEDLPDNWDWRGFGRVTPVKDQGHCGSCWAFATVAVAEAMACIAGRGSINYAEQQMVDCVDDGCNGGHLDHAFGYTKDHGLPLGRDYPYHAAKGQCHNSPIGIKFSGMAILNSNENDMGWYLHDRGPFAVSFMNGPSFQHYRSGIMTNTDCYDRHGWHAVAVVGFGTENGHRYWISKNSWGTGWGEQGFFRSARGSNWCDWTVGPVAGWL